MKEEIKEFILEKVSNGIKGVDLAVYLAVKFVTPDISLQVVEEMIKAGDILEVQYSVPQMNYRMKSFLLPKGSEVKIYGQEPFYIFNYWNKDGNSAFSGTEKDWEAFAKEVDAELRYKQLIR